MFVRSRRGGECWSGFMKRCLCFAWRNPGSLSLCENDCHPTLCEQVLHELVFIRLQFLRRPGCMQLFLCFFNLFKFPFLIIYLQYFHILQYNTYKLTIHISYWTVQCVTLYFGEPAGHVKIQQTIKNIPQYYTLDHPVISFNSRSTKQNSVNVHACLAYL